MRIALTHLRTAILFFSPMVVGHHAGANKGRTEMAERASRGDARSGRRDRAAQGNRQTAASKQSPIIAPGPRSARTAIDIWRGRSGQPDINVWSGARPIGSSMGPGRSGKGKRPSGSRAAPIAAYCVRKLTTMAEEASEEEPQAFENGYGETASAAPAEQEAVLFDRISRRPVSGQGTFRGSRRRESTCVKAQKSLGQLNDDARGHALATALEREGVQATLQFLSDKREKRLIRTAAAAYRKLAALK